MAVFSSAVTFSTSDLSGTSDAVRFVLEGNEDLASKLRTGHYDYDIRFVAHFSDHTRTRTVLGGSEIVNLVSDSLGSTEFGKR